MKYVPYFIIIIVIYIIIGQFFSSNYKIPDNSIRVRVIANSDEPSDQRVKQEVKDIVINDMYNLLKDSKTIDSSRNIINLNIDILSQDIDKYLNKVNYNLGYNINYGYNYFPKKIYKGVEYKEGMYESLVVTLGSGQGENWWCVLFPPICMIEAEEDKDVEYTTMVKEIVNQYL